MIDDEPAPNSPEDVGFKPGVTFTVPPGTPQRACRSCNAPIFWIVTGRGKRMPVDATGVSHFATCPNAAQHRRTR